MNSGADRGWPYLSPARPGWWLVSGVRGRLRRLLAEERQRGRVDPLVAVLDALTEVEQVVRAAETDQLLLIAEAYRRGASWAEIARRLGRAKQSVHQRYQGRLHTTRTRGLLADDLTEAVRQARALCHREAPAVEAAEACALLRERDLVPPRGHGLVPRRAG